jgi:hypothetical protein
VNQDVDVNVTRLARIALGVAVLAGLVSCGYEAPRAAPDADGRENTVGYPLQGPRFQGSVLKPDLGSSFAQGTLIVFNRGPARLRLDRVTPVGVDEGLRPLGVRIAGLDRKIGFDQSSPWPITGPEFGQVRPPEGYILEPSSAPDADRGYEILLGYKVVATGRSTVKGVRVAYTDLADGSARSVTFRETLAVCPDAADDEDCAVEEGR